MPKLQGMEGMRRQQRGVSGKGAARRARSSTQAAPAVCPLTWLLPSPPELAGKVLVIRLHLQRQPHVPLKEGLGGHLHTLAGQGRQRRVVQSVPQVPSVRWTSGTKQQASSKADRAAGAGGVAQWYRRLGGEHVRTEHVGTARRTGRLASGAQAAAWAALLGHRGSPPASTQSRPSQACGLACAPCTS